MYGHVTFKFSLLNIRLSFSYSSFRISCCKVTNPCDNVINSSLPCQILPYHSHNLDTCYPILSLTYSYSLTFHKYKPTCEETNPNEALIYIHTLHHLVSQLADYQCVNHMSSFTMFIRGEVLVQKQTIRHNQKSKTKPF